MRHCAYGRVSSLEQAENTNAAIQQKSRLLKSGAQKIFFDIESGTDDDRPQFQELLEELKKGSWDKVTVTRDDRITRNGRMALELLELFPALGVELEILDAGGVVDFSNPYSWMQRAQAGINSQYESMMLSYRVKKGYEHLRNEKKANPQLPFGYTRINEKYYIDIKLRNELLDYVEIFKQERSLRKTCGIIRKKHKKSFTSAGLSIWLRNPVLRGHTPYFYTCPGKYKQIIYNTHPDQTLISEEDFKLISSILEDNARYKGINLSRPKYPFTGITYCGYCGAKMDILCSKNINYYQCQRRRLDTSLCDHKKCIPFEELENKVINFLEKECQNIINLACQNALPEDSPQIQEFKFQINELQKINNNSIINKAIEDLHEKIKEQERVVTLNSHNNGNKHLLIKKWGEDFKDKELWLIQPPEIKRSLYQNLIKKIVVKDREIMQLDFVWT